MKEEAEKLNAAMVFNVKFETSRIGGGVPTIEVLAYGTALFSEQSSAPVTSTHNGAGS